MRIAIILLFTIAMMLLVAACKKEKDIAQLPPSQPPVTDTTHHTDTTKPGMPDTVVIPPPDVIDTLIEADPGPVVITTTSMDSSILEFGNLFTFYIRLESYTGDDVTAKFHSKGTFKVREHDPANPLYDQYLTFSDTPPKYVTDSLTLKDTAYTHWEVYNKLTKQLVYIILIYDKQFVGSPEVIYRLTKRNPGESEVTPEQLQTAVEKNEYGVLNWNIF